eukprot:1140539-Pelagomonas_calceolata.AAC.2
MALPQTVILVRLMMMPRMLNMSSSIAHIPRWSLSAGNMLPRSHREKTPAARIRSGDLIAVALLVLDQGSVT